MTVAFLYACGLSMFAYFQRQLFGFNFFALANLSIGLGVLLLGLRDIVPDFVSILIANSCILLGPIFYYEGIKRFAKNKKTNALISNFSFFINFLLFYYFTYEAPSINNRIITISFLSALICFFSAIELLNNLPTYWNVSGKFTAALFALFGFYQIFRIFWTFQEAEAISFMTAGFVHAIALISLINLVVGTSFGLIWMVITKLQSELIEQATTDQLTGILNRRGMENLAKLELLKNERLHKTLSIILLDLDHFKNINDTLGHAVGDDVLITLCRLLESQLRPYDIFGRLGGEEFIIFLPETNLKETHFIAERLRLLIQNNNFLVQGHNLNITCSFGIAVISPDIKELKDLIYYADIALYEAKRNGRNNVVPFSDQLLNRSN